MKKFSWLLAAALPIAFMFSCQKQIASDESAPAGLRTPTMRTAQPLTWQISPNPAVAGSPVTVCAPIPCGKAKILLSIDGGPYNAVTDYLQGGHTPNQVCYTFTPDAASCNVPTPKYRFALEFAPGAGAGGTNCQGGGFNANSYENTGLFCLNTPTETVCTDANALTMTNTAQVLSSSNGWSTIKVTICVTACKAVPGVRVQGGATAGGNVGAQEVSWSDQDLKTSGYPNYNNNNIVYSWTKDFAAGETKCFTFTYSRAFTACGSVTGSWSAKSANGLSEANADPAQACP